MQSRNPRLVDRWHTRADRPTIRELCHKKSTHAGHLGYSGLIAALSYRYGKVQVKTQPRNDHC